MYPASKSGTPVTDSAAALRAAVRSRRPWRRRIWRTIDVVFVIITFGFAIYNYEDAKELADTLSTHYIGSFPGFLLQLQVLVEQSNSTLLIACDVPGYGVFSSHDDYVAYHAALLSKIGRVQNLKVIVLDDAGRDKIMKDQFRGVDLRRLKQSREFRRFSEWAGYRDEDIPDIPSFENVLVQLQKRILLQDFVGKNIPSVELGTTMPVFVWISDNKVAVFSIPSSRTPPSQENAFITRDPKLIKQLKRIFRTYESKAKPIQLKSEERKR